jgi:hypothetical protein
MPWQTLGVHFPGTSSSYWFVTSERLGKERKEQSSYSLCRKERIFQISIGWLHFFVIYSYI